MKGKIIYAILSGLILTAALFAPAAAEGKRTARILLIPLDDRPPCLQFPVRMGEVGDTEVVTPPRPLLGRFTEFGRSDEIIEWLKTQNLRNFDAAIVSVDMLAYGGLVAMREHAVDERTARRRLEFVRELRRRAPRLKIYGSSVIMRLAPTANIVNEAYREKLARWAEISADDPQGADTVRLEREIPAAALADYKAARARDLQINLAAVELVRERVFDYLILSQDDAKPKGVHIADRETLIARVRAANLGARVGVQPGADEVSMLLLARALSDKFGYRPKIKVVYSSNAIREQFMPYEDRPLHQTVSFQISSVGGVEVDDERAADIVFFVYASRFEKGRAESFAREIEQRYRTSEGGGALDPMFQNPFIIADVDPKGDVQGADPVFTEALLKNLVFRKASGYAAWNTAGNTIGTALPHGFILNLVRTRNGPAAPRPTPAMRRQREAVMRRVALAQTWFMANRLLDDYVYHSLVRPDAIKAARARGWNVFRLTDEQRRTVEDEAGRQVRGQILRIMNLLSPLESVLNPLDSPVCESLDKIRFELPWNRTFEAEIEFELACRAERR